MPNGRLACLLIIFQLVFAGSKLDAPRNSFLLRLINYTHLGGDQFSGRKSYEVGLYNPEIGSKCKFKCVKSSPRFLGRTQARFTDQGANDTETDEQMEAPAGKFSILNLLTGDEEEEDEDEDEDHDNDEDYEKVKEEDDDDGMSFFEDFEENGSNKLEGTANESLLKQYHRQRLRMHNFVFPLLLAYKLKFFTVIPLLLGTLVLLVGTTGMAGFFFALFAAALGVHVKTHDH